MKQFIVLVASVLLGCQIFMMIASDNPGSIKSAMGRAWENEIALRTYTEVNNK